MAAEESARFVRRTGVAVTPEVLEQLDADVKWLAVDYRRRPKYAMFRPLAGLRRDVFDMIDRHPRPAHLIDLYRVAGQLSSLLALASFDLGQPYAADNHARAAWLCADLADNNTLRPYIRWVQSSVAYWRGEYRDAAELAQSGQRFAGGAATCCGWRAKKCERWPLPERNARLTAPWEPPPTPETAPRKESVPSVYFISSLA